jgi:uncharacterized protein YdhG (YjbR/CyaY superfamily)
MATSRPAPANVEEYIAAFAPNVQTILRRVRQAVRSAAPDAIEVISYRIPAFRQNGVLVYFAAFKTHIGLPSRVMHGSMRPPRRIGVRKAIFAFPSTSRFPTT